MYDLVRPCLRCPSSLIGLTCSRFDAMWRFISDFTLCDRIDFFHSTYTKVGSLYFGISLAGSDVFGIWERAPRLKKDHPPLLKFYCRGSAMTVPWMRLLRMNLSMYSVNFQKFSERGGRKGLLGWDLIQRAFWHTFQVHNHLYQFTSWRSSIRCSRTTPLEQSPYTCPSTWFLSLDTFRRKL